MSPMAKRAIWDSMHRPSRFDMLSIFLYSGETRHPPYLLRVLAESTALLPLILA